MKNSDETVVTFHEPSAHEMSVSTDNSKKKGTWRYASLKQKYPLVEVIWDDAAGLRHGWESEVDKLEPQLVRSIGFLLFDGPDHVIIAMDLDGEGQHNGRSQIPKGMLRQIRTLRKANVRK